MSMMISIPRLFVFLPNSELGQVTYVNFQDIIQTYFFQWNNMSLEKEFFLFLHSFIKIFFKKFLFWKFPNLVASRSLIALPKGDKGPKCNFFIYVQTLSIGFNCLKPNNAYSILQMISNEKVINNKVVDLIDLQLLYKVYLHPMSFEI